MQVLARVPVEPDRLPAYQPPRTAEPVVPVKFIVLEECQDVVFIDSYHRHIHRRKVHHPERKHQFRSIRQYIPFQRNCHRRFDPVVREFLFQISAEPLSVRASHPRCHPDDDIFFFGFFVEYLCQIVLYVNIIFPGIFEFEKPFRVHRFVQRLRKAYIDERSAAAVDF